jgi:hypothetical protein
MSGATPSDRARTAQNNAQQMPAGSGDPVLPCQRHWIEIQLLDDNDNPIGGENYRITGPDGQDHTGTLDDNGLARVDDLPAGSCKVTFPDRDGQVWDTYKAG